MKKNLKKALSAVIALAVAVSMIPASFAAKLTLTDVADTASYATAVKTLVALDIINGYEDNSFKPDDLITRAETTKIVVAALNKISAAEGMKGDTGFSDIQAKHEWATGFINVGVLEGFINGMENNTFGPDLNVTYAQIVTMLVRALGYEDYAKYLGGWPNGYLSIGNSEGITKGVSAAANANVTRAQVATLVYNAINTPIVLTTGMTYDSTAGGFVPHITKYDGAGTVEYRSLLTDKFEGYAVEGFITNNHSSKKTLDEDVVEFRQTYGEEYAETQFNWTAARVTSLTATSPAPRGAISVKVGFTDAADYNGAYVKAIIRENDDHEWEFISVETEKNVEVTVEAKNINTKGLGTHPTTGKYILETALGANDINYLQYFASSTSTSSTKYELNVDASNRLAVEVYVNGNKVAKLADGQAAMRTAISDYILNSDVGTIKFVDTFMADGDYDAIYIDAYATAKVSSVNASTGKISLSNTIIPQGAASSGSSAYITLDKNANSKLSYHIYYNGEEITINDLKIDDVISIAYNTQGTLADSDFYNIYVSRDVATATLTSKISEDETLVFGENEYGVVGQYVDKDFTPGNEYTLWLDAFGRIFTFEESVTADKYAIVDKFKAGSDDVYRATLYTAEGAQKNYAVDYNVAKIYYGTTNTSGLVADLSNNTTYTNINAKKTAGNNAIGSRVYTNWSTTTQSGTTADPAIQNRVVKYKINTVSNKITEITFLTGRSAVSKTFNERVNSIDVVRMDATTKIVDTVEYSTTGEITDFAMMTLENFMDDKTYTAYAFGDKINGSTIDPFVIVTAKPKAYDENTRFAVVAGAFGSSKDEDQNDVYTLPVFYKGESDKQTIIFTQDQSGVTALKTGDVIVFKTNGKGQADGFYKISNLNTTGSEAYNCTSLLGAAAVNLTGLNAYLGTGFEWKTAVSDVSNKPVTVLYGPIIARNAKSITLGRPVTNNAVKYTVTNTAGVTFPYNVTYEAGPMTGSPAVGTIITAGTSIPTGVTVTVPGTAGITSVDQDNSNQYVTIGVSSSTNAYMYDYSVEKNRISTISATSIPFNSFDRDYISNDHVIYWGIPSGATANSNNARTNFAFVTVSEGVALDILVLAAN